MMRFASGSSDAVNAQDAVNTAGRHVQEQLGGLSCDLAYLFVSTIYRAAWPEVLAALSEMLQPRVLIGCSGSGIIGGERELEWVPAVSILAAHLPEVRLFPFHMTPEELDVSTPGGFWIDKIGAMPQARPLFTLFVDPLTMPPAKLIAELNATYRASPMIGGLISGGTLPGEHLLFHGHGIAQEGAVGVAMTGNITLDTVVSQGCRPIGRPMIVTKAEENIIWQLGGKPALTVLHEALAGSSPEDRELAQHGAIFAGLAISEMRQSFISGDFLIRNIVGIDPDGGAVAVADHVEVGQTLQFQLRDPATSRQELRRLLQHTGHMAPAATSPAGCLLLNCSARGKSLYGTAHQDLRTIQLVSGKLPIGGLFCNGEIGPVGGTNVLQTYTASIGL